MCIEREKEYEEVRPPKRKEALYWTAREWVWRERHISGCLLDFEC